MEVSRRRFVGGTLAAGSIVTRIFSFSRITAFHLRGVDFSAEPSNRK